MTNQFVWRAKNWEISAANKDEEGTQAEWTSSTCSWSSFGENTYAEYKSRMRSFQLLNHAQAWTRPCMPSTDQGIPKKNA